MKQVRRSLLVCLIMCLAAVPATAQEVNRVVAVVGDEVITLMDLDKMLLGMEAKLAAATWENPNLELPTTEELHRLALDRLVEDKIFDQAVRKERITASDEELDRYIDRIKETNRLTDEAFAAQLSRRGMSPEEYRDELKRDILKHKLVERAVKSRVVVSDAQIDQYYRENEGQYEGLDRIRFRALFLTLPEDASPIMEDAVKAKSRELYERAKGGEDFAVLCRNFSQGPGAGNGGELGPLSSDDLLPAMRQALAELKINEICPPMRITGNYVFMQMLERLGGQSAGLSEQMREQIRAKLESEALEKRFQEWLKQVRSQVYVQILY